MSAPPPAPECDAIQQRASAFSALSAEKRGSEMRVWHARVESWEALFIAYQSAATELAMAGHDGVQHYVNAVLQWLAFFQPDQEDIARPGGPSA